VPGHREIQIRHPVPGIARGDPEPDVLPPDTDIRVMPYLARFRRHVHRQVHAFVIVVLAQAPLDFAVGQRFSECHRAEDLVHKATASSAF